MEVAVAIVIAVAVAVAIDVARSAPRRLPAARPDDVTTTQKVIHVEWRRRR
jgi:hypothetical protein